MADIDVERKSSPTWLWWLLGLIVLALLIWALTRGDDEVETAEIVEPAPVVTPTDPAVAPLPGEIQAFRSECTEAAGTPTPDMGLQHQFTVDCLERLRESLAAIVVLDTVGGVDVQQQLEDYEAATSQLEASAAEATTHSSLTREAATTAATLMAAMRDAYFQASSEVRTAVDEVTTAAEGISGETQLLDQRDAVHAFFRESADALEAMWQGFGTPAV